MKRFNFTNLFSVFSERLDRLVNAIADQHLCKRVEKITQGRWPIIDHEIHLM